MVQVHPAPIGKTREAPGFWPQIGTAPTIAATCKINQQMEDSLSVFPSYYDLAFQLKNLFFKGRPLAFFS